MQKSPALTLEEILGVSLPHRLAAIKDASWALDLLPNTASGETVQATIAGDAFLEGNLVVFLEPIVENGFMHTRALLEFLGLVVKNGKLIEVKRRRPSDVAIEHYCFQGESIPKVSLEEVFQVINMPRPVVEWALVQICENANKLFAHVTTGEVLAMAMKVQIQVALDAMPKLLGLYLYERLGLPLAPEIGGLIWGNGHTAYRQSISKI